MPRCCCSTGRACVTVAAGPNYCCVALPAVCGAVADAWSIAPALAGTNSKNEATDESTENTFVDLIREQVQISQWVNYTTNRSEDTNASMSLAGENPFFTSILSSLPKICNFFIPAQMFPANIAAPAGSAASPGLLHDCPAPGMFGTPAWIAACPALLLDFAVAGMIASSAASAACRASTSSFPAQLRGGSAKAFKLSTNRIIHTAPYLVGPWSTPFMSSQLGEKRISHLYVAWLLLLTSCGTSMHAPSCNYWTRNRQPHPSL